MPRTFQICLLVFVLTSPAAYPQTAPPVLLIDVSGRLINTVVGRSVDRTESVEEVIQETPVHGIGRTRGYVNAELIPSSSHGLIDIVFRGQIDSRTVGTRPHTLVHTVTATPLEVRRRVVFDGFGIRTFPGGQAGFASSQLIAVTGKNGDPDAVGTDFVRRGFYQAKSDAEAETFAKTTARLSDRLNSELSPALDSVRQSGGGGLKRMKAGGLKVESVEFNTSGSHLQANVRIDVPNATSIVVPPMPGDHDVGLRVHQSLINEAARLAYGGRAITVNKVSGFYEEVTMNLLRDGRKEREKQDALKELEKAIATLAGKPTTINLAKKDPITIVFVENGFTIDAHISSIRFDQTEYAGGRMQAAYYFEQDRNAVHLVRKQPVKLITFDKPAPGQKKFEVAPEAYRHLQELLFAEVLKERLIVNELPMPDALGEVRFQTPRVGARDGWLGIALNLAPKTK